MLRRGRIGEAWGSHDSPDDRDAFILRSRRFQDGGHAPRTAMAIVLFVGPPPARAATLDPVRCPEAGLVDPCRIPARGTTESKVVAGYTGKLGGLDARSSGCEIG